MKQFLRHIFLLVALFMTTTNAWAEKQIVELLYTDNLSSDFDDDELKKITQGTAVENNVKFTISNSKSYDNGAQEYLYFDQLDKNSSRTETFSWTIDKQNTSYPFRVEVQKVQCKIKGYQAVISTKTANAFFSGESATDCKTNNLSVDDSYKTISTSDGRIVGTSIALNMQSSGQKTTFHLQDIRYTYKIYQEVPLFQYKAKVIADPNGGGVVSVSWDNINFQYSENEAMAVVTWSKKDVLDVATGGEAKTAYFKAESKDGYQFVGWTYDPNSTAEPISTNPIYSVSNIKSYTNDDAMDPQVTLYAIFKSKKQPVVRGNDIADVKVDTRVSTGFVFENVMFPLDTLTNGEVDFYYMINHYPDNTSKADSPDPSKVIYYDVDRNEIVALNSGYAIITFNHKDSESYYALPEPKSFKVTVGKHSPVFTLNPEVSSSPEKLYFNKDYPDYFTTTANTPLTLTSSDTLVAKWVQGSNSQSYTLKTFSKTNTATLTAIQHENYYWERLEGSIEIQLQDPNNHVPFTIDSEAKMNVFALGDEMSWSNGGIQIGDGGDGFDYGKELVIHFIGIPKDLSFTYAANSGATTGEKWEVHESVDGVNWSSKTVWSASSGESGTVSNQPLLPTTRYLKFYYGGNFGCVYQNIHVTELKQFSAVDKVDGDKHLDFGANQVQSTKTVKFDLKYANVGYKVTAVSNNNRFKVTPAINTEIGGERYGTYEEYSVSYTSDVLYETVGDESYILLEDELGNSDKIYLHASSYKASQNITWRADFAAVDEPAIRKSDGQIANAAKASSGLTVTYTSEDPDIIEVIDDGKVLLPKKAGRVKITASQAGNSDTWEAASNEEKWFIVTDKMLQYILWSDALTDLTEDDINTTKVLGAKVYVQVNAEGYEVEYSESQTGKIEYTSADNSIVSVEGNILTIHSTGQTTLTVRVTEDENYAAVSLVVPVMVKAKPVGCADELLLEHKDEVSFFAYNTSEIVKGPFAIDRDKGVPGTLEFQHYGASWDLGVQYYSGTIKAQYTTDDNSNWVDAKEVTPKEDQATTETGIALPRNATQIRFVRPSGGTGYHYVSNIQVHPAQYLETEDNVEEVNFGEILIGSTVTTSLNINYSNIKSEIYPVLSSNELSADPVVFGQCGAFGTQTLNISWRPSVASDAVEETLTLRDELTGMVKEVKLTAIVIKGEQKITWERPATISTCLEFPEETDVHVAVEWEIVSGEDCASFEGNMLNIYKSGNIQVKGSAAESDNYKAYSIVYNFVVDYNPTYIGDDGNWNDPSNWNICRVPLKEDAVTIQAAIEINSSITTKGIILAENATIHITSTGGLTIGQEGITGAKENGTSIIIDNTPAGAGFLKVDPTSTNKPDRVTVNYATEAYNSGNPRDEVWQYMGAPGSNMQMSDAEKTTIYHWDEVKGWVKQSGTSLKPFVGYAFTQNKADSATFTVTATPIIPTEVQEIELTVTPTGMGGSNLFVNSFLAPIDLATFTGDEFVGEVDETFYLFNSGSWTQWQNQGGSNKMNYGVSPGQYYALSTKGASLIDAQYDQTTIPPMQGVYVIARGNGAKIQLDYATHVFNAEASNQPMRAPQRTSDDFRRVRLQVNSENSGADRMYVIQHDACTAGYDNGYDARNMAVSGQVGIYTHEVEGQMEISVSNKIDSTYIGFRAGSDSEYTLRMTSVVGEELYLKDLSEDLLIPVVDGQDYTFTATPNSVNDTRFLLLTQKSGVATDVEALQVYIHDNLVHVIEAPENSSLVIYTIGGVAVANYSIGSAPCTIDLCGLPTGVYVLRINDKAYKFVCK